MRPVILGTEAMPVNTRKGSASKASTAALSLLEDCFKYPGTQGAVR